MTRGEGVPIIGRLSSRELIDVGGVLQTGRELSIRERLSLPDFASFRFVDPASVMLEIRRLGRGIELAGTIDAQALGECARCLDEVRLGLHLEIDENLDPAAEHGDPLGESNVLDGDELDLGDLVRQLIDSELPYVVVCAPSCRGLCPQCGQKRDGGCRCPQSE